MQVEHEYFRCGAWTYIAGLDVHHARIFGRCEEQNGIEPFDRLVEQVMTRPPYNDARRVFWIVDNCSAHRGSRAVQRLQTRYPSVVLVHAPIHASWLNQVEIYFSLLQRKVLTPNDSADLQELELRIKLYEELTNQQPVPFDWRFTKYDLFNLLQRLASREAASRAATSPANPRLTRLLES
jgi:hypothetical protein